MVDRVAQFLIGIGGDDADLRSIFTSIKSRMRSDVAELEKISNSADLFSQLTANVPKIEAAFQRATARAAELRAQIEKIESAGGKAPKALTDALAAQEKAAAAAAKELARENSELAGLSAKLKAGGVDTSKLASEQLRLAEALKAANAAAAQQSAKDLLGFKSLKDVQPDIDKLTKSFDLLKASGKLSASEITAAQGLLRQKIGEVRGEVATTGSAFSDLDQKASSALSSTAARVLAPVAAMAVLTSGIKAATAAAHEYTNGVAEIGTVTNLTKEQLDALGRGARAIAADLGLDLTASLKALFELIRSGISPDNALEVLRVSAEASKAALTDVGTGARAANVLISGLGVPVNQLGRALDVVARGAKDGGATLAEFANNAGPLVNVAKAAGISFDELIAVLTVMTNASNDAEGSISALQKIIVNLQTAEARQKLRELGIEGTSLVTVFTELGKRNLGLDQLLGLGVASTKSAAGVAALTNNAQQLVPELDNLGKAAGTNANAVRIFLDTPKDRADRFNAALHDAAVNIGLLFGPSSVIATRGTTLLRDFNGIFEALSNAGKAAGKLPGFVAPVGAATLTLINAMHGVKPAADGFADGLDRLDRLALSTKAATEAAAAGAKKAQQDLSLFANSLAADSQALQAAAARDIADLAARADAQIAALDRSSKATAATAAATIEIQQQLAKDRLKILTESEVAITKVTEEAIAARTRIAGKSDEEQKKLTLDLANARIAALGPVLASYQAHYNQLVALAQASAAKVNAVEKERVSFNEDVEKQLRDIRAEGLSQFDQYLAKVKEIDDAISKARQAAATGDLELVKKYTDQAIALSGQVKTAVNADGIEVISAFDVQQTKITKISAAAKVYNEALSATGDAAKSGADKFKAAADDTAEIIKGLQLQYDTLKKTIAEGVQLKVEFDQNSVSQAFSILDELSKPRTTTITVNTVQGNSAGGAIGTFARGGHVPRAAFASAIGPIAHYARGGGVFRKPAWSKVPGSGDGDTVPAMLQAGSFVVRKAASKAYGDGIMAQLARAYATGGGAFPSSSDPKFREGGSIGAANLPSDPKALKKLVLKYVDDVKTAALVEDFFYWRPLLDALNYAMSFYERAPTEENLMVILERARSIGLNLGAPKGTLSGFDVDGRKWHKSRINISGQADSVFNYEFYNRGGVKSTDTVPAMLTPGEWVIPKRAAAALGGNLLHAINSMRIAPPTLRAMVAGISMAPPVRRFSDGGAVPGTTIPTNDIANRVLNGGQVTGNDIAGRVLNADNLASDIAQRVLNAAGKVKPQDLTVNINGVPIDALLSRENVRRYIVPEIEKLLRGY